MRLVRLICLTCCTYTEMRYEVGEVDLSNLLYLHRDAVRGW